MLKPVTDPELLKQLGEPKGHLLPVSDPEILKQLNGEPEEPSKLGSFARGVMSGVPGAETAVSGIEALSPDTTFEEAHQGLEEAKNRDWETNPVSYGAGKATGMVGTAIAAPASIPGAIGVGALSGLDAASKISELPKSAVEGGAVGGMLGTVGEKVVSPLLEKLPGLAKGAVSSMGAKTSVEDIQNYLNNPEAIRKALSPEDIAGKIGTAAQELGQSSGQLSNIARTALSPTNAPISITDIKPILQGASQKYLTSGVPATAQDEAAVNVIKDQYGKLLEIANANNGAIPETELRGVIDRLQSMANFNEEGNVGTSLKQKVAGDLQHRLKDILEQTNPDYAEKMVPAAEAANLSRNLKDQFNIEGGQPTETTLNKIKNVGKEGKFEGQDLLNEVKNATGQDINDMIAKSKIKGNFEAPGAGGGLRALLPALGYAMGRSTGVPLGGIAGAGLGHFAAGAVDGGQVAKSILDTYIKGADAYSNSIMKPIIAKFGPVLANAAKAGGNQLAATHFVLATSNPEYQKLVDHVQNNTTDEGQ